MGSFKLRSVAIAVAGTMFMGMGMQAKAEHRRAQEDEDRDQQPLQHARPRPPAQVRMSNSQRRGTPSISEVPRPRRRTCSPCISSASTPWLAPVRLMLSAW